VPITATGGGVKIVRGALDDVLPGGKHDAGGGPKRAIDASNNVNRPGMCPRTRPRRFRDVLTLDDGQRNAPICREERSIAMLAILRFASPRIGRGSMGG